MDETRQDPGAAAPQAAAAMDAIISTLARTGPWVRFLAVLGFVGIGLAGLAGVVIVLAGVTAGDPGLGLGFGLFYLAIAAVYAIPLVPLHRLANEASRLRKAPEPATAARAIEHARSFWVSMAVLAIVGLALVPVVLLVSLLVGAAN